MNPYAEIRKVPLDYQGIQSNAYSVQRFDQNKGDDKFLSWKEVGTVSNNYLLVDNTRVRNMAEEIVSNSNLNMEEEKTFFDGRRYAISYIAKDNSIGEVAAGDDVAIGFQMWNSYDGSTSLGFKMMIYRLVCTNGMMSHNVLNKYRFRHSPDSENWEKELEKVSGLLQAGGEGKHDGVNNMISNFKRLNEAQVNVDELSDIRFNHLSEIPTGTWGSVIDRFLHKGNTGWDLLNSATDELWHKEKATVASYNQNATIVDGLCNWVAA
tara:strand:- start:2256 stop:3053 length:798 start_codon:yes stop_codon:yes gene_type:complete